MIMIKMNCFLLIQLLKILNLQLKIKRFELKPNYSLLVEIKNSIISIKSNCVFFRPTIFSYKGKYLDVHHS